MTKEEKAKMRLEFIELTKKCVENEVFDLDKEALVVMHSVKGEKSTELTIAVQGHKKRLVTTFKKAMEAPQGNVKQLIVEAAMQEMLGKVIDGDESDEDDCTCPSCQLRREEITEEQYDEMSSSASTSDDDIEEISNH